MDKFIDLWLEQNNRKTRRDVFQNVADNPEVRGMDMMTEVVATFNVGDTAKLIVDPKLGVDQPGEELKVIRVEPQIGGKFFNVQVQNSKGEEAEYDNSQLALVRMGKISKEKEFEDGDMFTEIGVEGFVQTDETFNIAMNEVAIERAMRVASELDTLQNDLEAELSDDELDNISDVIALLRQKRGLNEATEKQEYQIVDSDRQKLKLTTGTFQGDDGVAIQNYSFKYSQYTPLQILDVKDTEFSNKEDLFNQMKGVIDKVGKDKIAKLFGMGGAGSVAGKGKQVMKNMANFDLKK